MMGPGAGGDATAAAAIGDLVAIARDRAAIVPAPVLVSPKQIAGLTGLKSANAGGQAPLAGPGSGRKIAEAV